MTMTPHPALRVSGLRFAYRGEGDESFALAAPDFELAPGEAMLLTARSGAGKSTLLSLIAGLMDPEAGSVEIAGRCVHELRGASRDRFRGRHIGMIFQTFNLLVGFSAAENVEAAMLMGEGVPAREQRSRALVLLSGLGITRPEARVERLSVGQQQRVAVARAVACRPTLVLADEPTASLDPESAMAAMDLIQRACRDAGAALLCVSHDPAMRARFARVETLGGGSTR